MAMAGLSHTSAIRASKGSSQKCKSIPALVLSVVSDHLVCARARPQHG